MENWYFYPPAGGEILACVRLLGLWAEGDNYCIVNHSTNAYFYISPIERSRLLTRRPE